MTLTFSDNRCQIIGPRYLSESYAFYEHNLCSVLRIQTVTII